MKFTTEQLILAAEVRRLAYTMMRNATPPNLDEQERIEWQKNQTIHNWTMYAMEDIEKTASLIFTDED